MIAYFSILFPSNILVISQLNFLFIQGDSPEDVNAPAKWCRPQLPPYRADKDKLVFQQIDVDHYIGNIEGCFVVFNRCGPLHW